jgi:hypothetical protein
MRVVFLSLAVLSLAACGSKQPEQPAPAPTVAAAPTPTTPALSPPDKATLAALYKQACPKAKPVNAAVCQSEGFGKEGFICKFGFDGYTRYSTKLTPSDGKWVLADPDKACATGAAS